MPAPPTNASVSFTVPEGATPAILCAVGTSVGIGEEAHPLNHEQGKKAERRMGRDAPARGFS